MRPATSAPAASPAMNAASTAPAAATVWPKCSESSLVHTT